MYMPHNGERIHTNGGIKRFDANNKAIDNSENEMSMDVLAVIFPAIPENASRLNTVVNVLGPIPS